LSSAVSAAEMMEIGSRLLIMDDTSVSHGLLYRDEKISELIPEDDETIVPISEFIRGSGEEISAIVACRHGDLAGSANTVIIMSKHSALFGGRAITAVVTDPPAKMPADRIPMARNMSSVKGKKDAHATALSASKMEFGEIVIKIPQPVRDICEMSSIADAMLDAKEMMDGTATLNEITERLEYNYRAKMSSIEDNIGPDRAVFRKYDLAAVINRHPDIVFAQRPRTADE